MAETDELQKPEKVVRPPSSFLLFAEGKRKELRLQYPDKHFKELTSMAAASWEAMGAIEKRPFVDLYAQKKAIYDEQVRRWPELRKVRARKPKPLELDTFPVKRKRQTLFLEESSLSEEDKEENSPAEETLPRRRGNVLEQLLRGQRHKRVDFELVTEKEIEFAEKLLEDAQLAATHDRARNLRKEPATKKLQFLGTLVRVLLNTKFQRVLLEKNVLGVFCDWLSPLPDGSLVSAPVRRELYRLLFVLPVTVDALLECEDKFRTVNDQRKSEGDAIYDNVRGGIGRLLLYLWRREDENIEEHRKFLERIIEKWYRLVVGKTSRKVVKMDDSNDEDYVEKEEPKAD